MKNAQFPSAMFVMMFLASCNALKGAEVPKLEKDPTLLQGSGQALGDELDPQVDKLGVLLRFKSMVGYPINEFQKEATKSEILGELTDLAVSLPTGTIVELILAVKGGIGESGHHMAVPPILASASGVDRKLVKSGPSQAPVGALVPSQQLERSRVSAECGRGLSILRPAFNDQRIGRSANHQWGVR